MAWSRNEGRMPPEAKGKRVRVKLRFRDTPEPGTWPADGGRPATRWSLTGHAGDIIAYEVI
jgi:hypothetical protein